MVTRCRVSVVGHACADAADARPPVGRRLVVPCAPARLSFCPDAARSRCAVRLEDRGPALFRQERVGLSGSRFTLLKFRTMLQGGDDRALRDLIARELRGEDTVVNGSSKLDDDRRVTRVGAFLRRTSLDELPQLINVLRGDMTLVGPRPCLRWEAEMFPAEYASRFTVRPGLTGLWQVSGRSTLRHAGDAASWTSRYVRHPVAADGPGHPAAHGAGAAAPRRRRDDYGVHRDHRRPPDPAGRPGRAHPARPGLGVGDPRERAEHVAARRPGRRVHPVRRRPRRPGRAALRAARPTRSTGSGARPARCPPAPASRWATCPTSPPAASSATTSRARPGSAAPR